MNNKYYMFFFMIKETYNISSGPVPSITINVQPQGTVVASAGAFLSGSPMLEQATERFKSKGNGVANLLLSGESVFINRFTNRGEDTTELILSDKQIGTVVEVSDDLANGILCISGAFVAATADIDVGFKKVRDFSQAALTGQSLWMQRIRRVNKDKPCTVFLMAAATPKRINLIEGEKRLIDNESLFAMTEGTKLRLFENEGFKRAIGGGEGRFMTVVEGSGTVWIAPQRKRSSNFIQQIIKRVIPG